MARRPNIFSQQEFEESLRRQGCAESFISPITSDFRLFVPLLIREIGEEKLFGIVDYARAELELGEQRELWQLASRYIVGWAQEQIANYKAKRRME